MFYWLKARKYRNKPRLTMRFDEFAEPKMKQNKFVPKLKQHTVANVLKVKRINAINISKAKCEIVNDIDWKK